MDRTFRCCAHAGLVVLICVALVGCGGAAAPTAKVTGKVTDASGAALKGAAIQFSGTGKGYGSSGTVGDDGTYQLTTFAENDGAPPGDYTVSITDVDQKARTIKGSSTVSVKSGTTNTLDFTVD